MDMMLQCDGKKCCLLLLLLWRLQTEFVCDAFSATSRRDIIVQVLSGVSVSIAAPQTAFANDGDISADYPVRDRRGNKQAVIRDDYWFISGKLPPRVLGGPLQEMGNPQFNAFGSCETTGGQNSCTYLSLKQRIPAYSKYASSISYGAVQYQRLGQLLTKLSSNDEESWQEAATYLERQDKTLPPGIIDAELKMLLFATAMLTSPNFPGPSKELLVSRYYINELHFANGEILDAIKARDAQRAVGAWDYGKDAWNSYYQTIDRQIVEKVGDKFVPIMV